MRYNHVTHLKFLNAITQGDRIDLIFRNDEGVLKVRKAPVEYVSYHHLAQCQPHMSELRRTRAISGISEEGEFLRLRWSSFDTRKGACALDGPFASKGIKCLEADVGPLRRYTTDSKISIAAPRIAYLDIETDSRVPFSDKENARVLCWTLIDENEAIIDQGLLDHDTDEDERRIINQMWDALEPYDLLVAWMSVFFGEFDFEVIKARTEKLGANGKHVRRLLYLDHCKLFKRQNVTSAESGEEKRSFKLNSIAMTVLGEGKDNFDGSKTWEAWCVDTDCQDAGNSPEHCMGCRGCLLRYNAKDTVLMPRIEAKTGYIALFQTLCDVCGVFPESRSLLPSVQVDSFMLRLGRERGFHFPTKYYEGDETPQGQYAGAFVVELTRKGIIRNVHVGDFSSMYVNIIRTWNMSPDTICTVPLNGPIPEGTCRAPSTGIGFVTTHEGILAAAVNEVLRLRKYWNDKRTSCIPNTPEWKEADRRATAYKVAGNTFYGVIGSSFSRYHDRRIAESITQNGVWLIKSTIKQAELRGWEVVYGDTDAIYVVGPTEDEFRAFTVWLNAEFYPRIVAETGAHNYNSMAYEKEMERVVILAKKKYVGRLKHYKGKRATDDSEPVIAGLEYKRGDASRMAMNMQKECIDLLIQDRCEDPLTFEPILNKWLNHILNEELTLGEVVLSRSLSNNLSEYATKLKNDGTPAAQQPHIMLAKALMGRGLINTRRIKGKLDVPSGTRIEYVVSNSLAIPTEVVWAGEWKGECDRFHFWEKGTWPPTQRLLEAAFPAHDWSKYTKVRSRRKRSAAKVLEGQGAFTFSETDGLKYTAPQTGLRDMTLPFEIPSNVKVHAPTGTGAPAVPAFRRKRSDLAASPIVIRLRARDKQQPKRDMLRIGEILAEHPGKRAVELHVLIGDDVAILGLPFTAAGTPELIASLRETFGNDAA